MYRVFNPISGDSKGMLNPVNALVVLEIGNLFLKAKFDCI
jgi:hypothetical protein